MARHTADGDQVTVIIVAEGLTSRASKREEGLNQNDLNDLQKMAIKANGILGVKNVSFVGLPDNRLDSVDLIEIVKAIQPHVDKIAPDVIYTHFPGDLNIDHQLVSRAVLTALRPQPNVGPHEIYFFEVPSATEWFPGGPSQEGGFRASSYVNIEKYMPVKLEALRVYETEMRDFPHARSLEGVEALAKWRGSTVGFRAAEAFQLARQTR